MIEDKVNMYRIQQKYKITGKWTSLRVFKDRDKALKAYTKMITSRYPLTNKDGIVLLPEFRLTKVEELVILEDEHMPQGE